MTGKPPTEDAVLGKAVERVFLPVIRLVLPEIVDMNLPMEGLFINVGIVSVRKQYPDHPRKVMHALWGLGQIMFVRYLIVVDDDVDVHDLHEVLYRVGLQADPERDLELAHGPVDQLSISNPVPNLGAKVGIDATPQAARGGVPASVARGDPIRPDSGRRRGARDPRATPCSPVSCVRSRDGRRREPRAALRSSGASSRSRTSGSTCRSRSPSSSSRPVGCPPSGSSSSSWSPSSVARNAGHSFNRWADRDLDAANPRTQGRAIPSGRRSPASALAITAVSAAVLIGAAYLLNPLAFVLAPVALAIVLGYSYTKRYTVAHDRPSSGSWRR